MENNNPTIKERIIKYIESKSIKKDKFCRIIGISPSNFKGNAIKSEIGGNKITIILDKYPDLNPEWLLTGRGTMQRQVTSEFQNILEEPQAKYSENLLIETQRELIKLQKDKIMTMQQEILMLKKQLNDFSQN